MQAKRWRVLIVDDEFRIGMLIRKLIKWEEIGLECVNVVDNGEAAYNIILSEKPDIVITDIKMPKVNGLDLIRMIKEKDEPVKFIVISGYKEFEYAHKALQYGVSDYLLKPIKEEELNKVLKRIQEELIKSHLKQDKEGKIERAITTSVQIIKSNLLNNIIEQTDALSVDEMQEEYNLEFDAAAYRGITIKLDYSDYEKSDRRQDRITVEKLLTIIEKNFEGTVKEQLICEKDNLNIYCLINYDLTDSKQVNNVINRILIEIQEYLLGLEQYKVTIGIGLEKTGVGEIRFSIQEAYQAVQNRIKAGTGRLIYAERLQFIPRTEMQKYLIKYKEQLRMSIETLSKELFENVINQIYGEFQFEENTDFALCYDVANEIIDLYFETISVKNEKEDKLKQFLKNACCHCNTIGNLKGLLKKYLSEDMEARLKILETESVKPIRQAKQYIEEHYNEKIVLEDIAHIVDLNPVYFSVLFKKETGFNFTTYLVNIRMEMAKQMIRTSNKTIAAIADEVGYKDTRYFSQIFTKTVGVKPALYRKLHS
ncbi:response regulator [Kineothrix sedimenti]|uniref:Stage 0 sporulation protein A homolog n=1 Tax=Kineothrix sedimenti TaxID=3123317 RepID=A0ABZ3EUM2_9FIRM